MEISQNDYMKWEDEQLGKECPFHPGKLIKRGDYGNWCGGKTEVGTYCQGSKFPLPLGEYLTIKPE